MHKMIQALLTQLFPLPLVGREQASNKHGLPKITKRRRMFQHEYLECDHYNPVCVCRRASEFHEQQ